MTRRIRSGIIAVIVPAVLVAVLFVPFNAALVVTAAGDGGILLCARLADGEEFDLSYVHSVNRRPVVDTLAMGKGRLIIVRSRFDAFGAGMPDGSAMDGVLARNGKGMLIWTVNRTVPEVHLFVGRVADHAITIRGRTTALEGFARPGSSVTLRSQRISFYQSWKGGCLR